MLPMFEALNSALRTKAVALQWSAEGYIQQLAER